MVFPDPCSPASIITVGGRWENSIFSECSPIKLISSSWTIFTICWPGVILLSTCCPRAFPSTDFIKSLTTLKFTSASRRAKRTSFRPSWIFFSVSFPALLSFENTDSSLFVKFSNIISLILQPLVEKVAQVFLLRVPEAEVVSLHLEQGVKAFQVFL